MRTTMSVVAVFLLTAPRMEAQAHYFSAPSKQKLKECQYEYLLDGLPLSHVQRTAAKQLIGDYVDTTFVIVRQMGANRESGELRLGLERKMHEELKRFVVTREDSLRADKNAIAWDKAFRGGLCHGDPP